MRRLVPLLLLLQTLLAWLQRSDAQPAPGTILRNISTANIAGAATTPFNAVAVDPQGQFIYATNEGSVLWTLQLSTLNVTSRTSGLSVGVVEGLATSPTTGELFVGDARGSVLRLFPNGSFELSYSNYRAGPGYISEPTLSGVGGVAVAADGLSFYAAASSHAAQPLGPVVYHLALNGSVLQTIPVDPTGGVAVDARGNVFVAGLTNLTSFDSTGRQTNTAAYYPGIHGPGMLAGITVDASGNVYVATGLLFLVYNSNLTLRANLTGSLTQPCAVAVAPDGTSSWRTE